MSSAGKAPPMSKKGSDNLEALKKRNLELKSLSDKRQPLKLAKAVATTDYVASGITFWGHILNITNEKRGDKVTKTYWILVGGLLDNDPNKAKGSKKAQYTYHKDTKTVTCTVPFDQKIGGEGKDSTYSHIGTVSFKVKPGMIITASHDTPKQWTNPKTQKSQAVGTNTEVDKDIDTYIGPVTLVQQMEGRVYFVNKNKPNADAAAAAAASLSAQTEGGDQQSESNEAGPSGVHENGKDDAADDDKPPADPIHNDATAKSDQANTEIMPEELKPKMGFYPKTSKIKKILSGKGAGTGPSGFLQDAAMRRYIDMSILSCLSNGQKLVSPNDLPSRCLYSAFAVAVPLGEYISPVLRARTPVDGNYYAGILSTQIIYDENVEAKNRHKVTLTPQGSSPITVCYPAFDVIVETITLVDDVQTYDKYVGTYLKNDEGILQKEAPPGYVPNLSLYEALELAHLYDADEVQDAEADGDSEEPAPKKRKVENPFFRTVTETRKVGLLKRTRYVMSEPRYDIPMPIVNGVYTPEVFQALMELPNRGGYILGQINMYTPQGEVRDEEKDYIHESIQVKPSFYLFDFNGQLGWGIALGKSASSVLDKNLTSAAEGANETTQFKHLGMLDVCPRPIVLNDLLKNVWQKVISTTWNGAPVYTVFAFLPMAGMLKQLEREKAHIIATGGRDQEEAIGGGEEGDGGGAAADNESEKKAIERKLELAGKAAPTNIDEFLTQSELIGRNGKLYPSTILETLSKAIQNTGLPVLFVAIPASHLNSESWRMLKAKKTKLTLPDDEVDKLLAANSIDEFMASDPIYGDFLSKRPFCSDYDCGLLEDSPAEKYVDVLQDTEDKEE